MYEQRIETVRRLLGEMGLTQMVVSDPRSIQYLTGAYVEPGERFLALVVTKGKAPVLFLNRLFTAPKSLPCEVFSFDDVDNPLPEVAKLLHAEETCGVDKNLAARFLVPLMEAHAAKSFALGSPAVDGARAIKSVEEQELMRAASAPWRDFENSCMKVRPNGKSLTSSRESTAGWALRDTLSTRS